METLTKELFDWLAINLGWHPGTNAFMSRVPSSQTVQECYWLIANNNFVVRQFATRTKEKESSFLLNYRNVRARDVDNEIMRMENIINHLGCFKLKDYDVTYIRADSWSAAEDADAEGFYRGFLTINLRTIDNYESEV